MDQASFANQVPNPHIGDDKERPPTIRQQREAKEGNKSPVNKNDTYANQASKLRELHLERESRKQSEHQQMNEMREMEQKYGKKSKKKDCIIC